MIVMIGAIITAAIGIWLGCINGFPFTGALVFSVAVIVFTYVFKARRAAK